MKYIPGLLLFSLLIAFLILTNNFLAQQFALFLDFKNIGQLRLTSWFVTVFMLFGLPMSVNAKSRIGQVVYLTSTTLIGFMMYLCLSFILLNLIQYIVEIPPFYAGLSAVSLTILITIYGIWNAFNIRLTELTIPIKALKKDVKAVHLTDIHLGHVRGKAFLQEVVDKTNAQSPDVVFVTGDLFDGKINLSQDTLTPFAALKAPVFFIEGNHDNSSGVKIIKGFLRNLGIHVLGNQVAQWNELQIIGLNHMSADDSRRSVHTAGRFQTIQTTLPKLNIDSEKPTILLHHSPDGIQYAAQHGVDLYLTGHTHAGQLFPATLFAARIFAYNKGLHEYENTKILVSQGIGTFGPPMRVATKSEIISITLKAEIQ
jgi:predicted MPP superfamily phosphohydrolase